MKKWIQWTWVAVLITGGAGLAQFGCESTPTPLAANFGNTSTPTRTPTITLTPTVTATLTMTNTPNGTPTPTPTATTGSTPFILYANGANYNFGSIVTNTGVFNDSLGTGSPGLNATDSTAGTACCSDTQSYQVSFGNLMSGGYSGMQLVVTGSNANMTGFTTCTFYAKANQSCVVGFNAAESGGDYYSIGESLTTSWAQFNINIANATRTDGWGSPDITNVSNYFVVVIANPTYFAGNTSGFSGTFPLVVNFDQVSFQ